MSLSLRQLQVLRIMRDTDEELVYSKGTAYVGDVKIAPRTVFALLRLAAISMDQYSQVGGCERYTINETGAELVEGKAGGTHE
jgi:hypothetical protein